MSETKKEYGVEEYVPQEARHYGFWDMAAIWIGANAHPASWWVGGILASVGFVGAMKINLIANPLAAVFVALIGFIGYKVGTTTIGLLRVPLGIQGSKLAGLVTAVSLVGWTAISNFLAAITITYIFNVVFGTPVYGEPGSFWLMMAGATVNGILSMVFVAIGGSRSIAIAEKILVVGLLLMSGWITVVVFRTYNLAEIIAWVPNADIRLPFGTAFDYLFAYSVTWTTTCCEFTRYSKNMKSATFAPAFGLTIAAWWFIVVGALGTVAVAVSSGVYDPNMSDPSSLVSGLGMGWIAFFVIIMSTVTTNLINIYVGSYSIMALSNKLKPRLTFWIMGIVCIIVSWLPVIIGSFYSVFSTFLNYLGAVFPTVAAILIVDYYLIRKGNYNMDQIGKVNGIYWYHKGINWYGMVVWVASSVITFKLQQNGFGSSTIGAVLPGIFIAGAMYYVVAKFAISRKAYIDLEESA